MQKGSPCFNALGLPPGLPVKNQMAITFYLKALMLCALDNFVLQIFA